MGSSLDATQKPHPAWANHADAALGDDLNRLFEAGDAVEALQLHPGWGHVQQLIRREIRQVNARLDNALLPTRSDYAYLHGRLSGLKAAGLAAEAILSRAQKRLAEQRAKHEADGSPSEGA